MDKAVRTGGMILVAWIIYIEPSAWAQSGWPQPPSSNMPVQLTCGDPPPVITDPSPGDTTECWEYVPSSGWTRLFNCVEHLIECPDVTCNPVPGEGCACLLIGDSETFSFAKPTWDVGTGRKEIKPDNPNCGDATEVDFTASKANSWEVTGGAGVVDVSPHRGNGDAVFTATAIAVGNADLAVTWRLNLTMNENCPKDFTEAGPTVCVTVIDPNSPASSHRRISSLAAKGSGDCDVKEVNDVVPGNGGAIPPTLSIVSTCTKECGDDEKDCTKYRLVVKADVAKPPELKVGTKLYEKVPSFFISGTFRYEYCDRDPDRIKESKKHEEKHCEGYMAAVKAVKEFVDGHGLNNKIYADCATCQAKAKDIIGEAKTLWETKLEYEMNHNTFKGTDRPCIHPKDAQPGETPCDTDKRKCGTYDPTNPDDMAYEKPDWSNNVKQNVCN